MLKVSVIGDAFVDIFCPLLHGKLPFWGGDVLVDGVRTTCGGSASNTALQLASLVKGTEQWTVEFHTALGNDGWAGILKEKHDDLNCKLVNNTQDEGLTTGVCIVISGNSDRAFMTNHGALDKLTLESFDLGLLSESRHVHIGGMFSLPAVKEDLDKLVTELKSLNPSLTVSLDTNYDASEKWGGEALLRLLKCVDIFIPNETEAQGISGQSNIDDSLEWLCPKVQPGGLVLITCGADGVVGKQNLPGSTAWRVGSPNVPHVADTTGAGDAFNAGFLFSYLSGRSPQDAAAFAARGSAHIIQYSGACDELLTVETCSARS